MKNGTLKYVLITPARNEEDNIEKVINSMISQKVLPEKWVIVSDGSTDQTDDIVQKYLQDNQWMELLRMPNHADRHFAAKVNCFNSGYAKVKDLEFDIIGNLDADVTFDQEYLKYLLSKFSEDSKLGVAGTPFVENGKYYDYRFTNIEHVSGACQLFRRECFEGIEGYKPIRGGGIDWVAVTTARMKGWRTRTFTEKTCLHHRKIGSGNTTSLMTWFRQGKKDYFLGNHFLWEIFRTFYQMIKKPIIIGGTLLITGFTWSAITGMQKPISPELQRFIRGEQMQRLKNIVK